MSLRNREIKHTRLTFILLFSALFLFMSGNATALLSSSNVGGTISSILYVSIIIQAANDGDAEAQYQLSTMYEKGYGVLKDMDEAVNLLHTSASQGYANAQYALGQFYMIGKDIEQNDSMAINWYEKAAEQDHAIAQYSLGYMYSTGRGVIKNYALAVKWYELAAANGDMLSYENLAWLLATCPDHRIRDGQRAIFIMESIVENNTDRNPGQLDTLAAAYAEVGRFSDAVTIEQLAIELLDPVEEIEVVRRFTMRLKYYENHTPLTSQFDVSELSSP